MSRHFTTILIGLLILLTSAACTEEAKASADALQQAEKLIVSTPETNILWGMQTFRVFGRGTVLGLSDMAAGQSTTQVQKISDQPAVYAVIIPAWFEGTDLNGKHIIEKRTFYVELVGTVEEGTRVWRVQNYEARDIKPLSFGQQLWTWLGWSFLGPFLLGLIFVAWLLNWDFKAFPIIVGIVALPLTGYAAYICFGSVGAVVIGLILYIGVVSLLFLLLNAWAQSRLA